MRDQGYVRLSSEVRDWVAKRQRRALLSSMKQSLHILNYEAWAFLASYISEPSSVCTSLGSDGVDWHVGDISSLGLDCSGQSR